MSDVSDDLLGDNDLDELGAPAPAAGEAVERCECGWRSRPDADCIHERASRHTPRPADADENSRDVTMPNGSVKTPASRSEFRRFVAQGGTPVAAADEEREDT